MALYESIMVCLTKGEFFFSSISKQKHIFLIKKRFKSPPSLTTHTLAIKQMEQQSQASQDKLIPDPSGTGVLNILGIIDSYEKDKHPFTKL